MTLTTVTQYGQIARAMAAVQQHKHPTDEVKGRVWAVSFRRLEMANK